MNNLFRRISSFLAVAVFSATASAAPGSLDPSFGVGGTTSNSPAGTVSSSGFDVAIQSDGKILVAGACAVGNGTSDLCVWRFTQGGLRDLTFGTQGYARTSIPNDYLTGQKLVLQDDGKIVVAASARCGTAVNCVVFARYLQNGSLDSSFNGRGYVTSNEIGAEDFALPAMYVQPSGKIVVIGQCPASQIVASTCLFRIDNDGRLDATFGSGIKRIVSGDGMRSRSISSYSDGQFFVGGWCAAPDVPTLFCTARFWTDGTPDRTWNGTGLLISPLHELSNAAFRQDGRIVAVGQCGTLLNAVCAARFNSDGSVDESHNNGLVAQTTLPGNRFFFSNLAVQLNGKPVVSGDCGSGEACLLRLDDNGFLDKQFGNNGRVSAGVNHPKAIALQSDGKIVVAGICSGMCVSRYEGDPVVSNGSRKMEEFRYAPLDYYFMTSRDTEKAILDAAAGWVRTGKSFSVYANNDGVRSPIFRFYFDQIARKQSRGSHFYTAIADEVLAVQALNPLNQLAAGKPVNEGIDSYAYLPNAPGACVSGQVPVYRLFRGTARFPDDPNHRFTTELSTYNSFVALGWDGEGVKFCVPQ